MEKTATILAVPTVLMVCVNGTMVTVKMDVNLAGKWDVVTKVRHLFLLIILSDLIPENQSIIILVFYTILVNIKL